MTPYKKDSEVLSAFDEKFPCIQGNCDNWGTLTVGNEETGPEPEQCQYCYENRLPVRAFLLQTRHDDLRAIEEWAKNEKMEYEKMRQKEKFEPYRETIGGALSVLSDLLAFIQSLRK